MEQLSWILLTIVAFVFLYLILASFFTVRTAEVAVITRFGKFLRVAEPGLNWKRPFLDSVQGIVSLRVNQESDHADHGDQDQRQRLRHHSYFSAESRSSGKGL
jgi:regulator of protease activity HflC (stomatin/prohibitin superfamily)